MFQSIGKIYGKNSTPITSPSGHTGEEMVMSELLLSQFFQFDITPDN